MDIQNQEATCAHGVPWSQNCPSCDRISLGPSQPLMASTPINPNQRYLPVNVPLPFIGVTIAMVDSDGNVRIKKDQPMPKNWHED